MVSHHGMTCSELVELVTEYLEGALPPDARARFEAHLKRCAPCAHYLEQMRLTVKALGRLPESSFSPAVRDELLGVFRHWKSFPDASQLTDDDETAPGE
jgi:anti-sigma factor RsiW